MRPPSRGLSALSLLLSAACAVPDATAVRTALAAPVPSVYIVTFQGSVRDVPGEAKRLVAAHGGTLRFTYTHALHGFAATLPALAVAALARASGVAALEADGVVRAADVVQTPVPSWGLDRIDQRALVFDNRYGYSSDGAGVTVYIVDSGIRATHTEFEGRAVGAFSTVNDGSGTADCTGHGTHVAGIVGGRTVGVAKAVQILAVRVIPCGGMGTVSQLLAGLDWIATHVQRPGVVNISLESSQSATITTATQALIDAGLVVSVAAGNGGGADACAISPASVPMALTVGATWNGDGVSGYSNVGPCIDLFAPGSAITSASFTNDTSLTLMGGTSMAAPHVAGVAARYLSTHRDALPSEVSQAIIDSATVGVLSAVPAGTPNRLLFAGSVLPPPPPPPDTVAARVVVSPTSASILIGAAQQFTAVARNAADSMLATKRITWSSATPSIASVSASGLATGLSAGAASIVASADAATGSAALTVMNPPPPPPDQPPTAAFTVNGCPKGQCGFDASASSDDHGIVAYAWTFGDGAIGSGVTASHKYVAVGSYAVTLKVTDTIGQTATATKTVTVTKVR